MNVLHLCPDDRVSLLTSGTTNVIGNSLRALLSGASLHAFDVKRYGVESLAKWLSKEKITVAFIGASLFRELFSSRKRKESFDDLRIVGLRSDAMLPGDLELYKKHCHANCLLVNNYGTSETNTLTMNFFDHSSEIRSDAVPTGYAVKDKEIFVVNERRSDLGLNQVGEIAVRSRYIYRGYWNNSELTAAKFKADPQDPDKLIYFTGDLGLILPDGCLIHKGRKDFRVKIRGHAVDLVEVERALLEHPDVREAGVGAWDREAGEKFLAGYIAPQPKSALNASEIREFLRNKLADYMIPTTFQFMEALPFTNGKLDRLALPKPDTGRPELKEAYIAARNEVERKLAGIWSEVLQIDDVGIDDNFFDLGGHSLMASRVLSRVLDCFRVGVSLRSFFESPTLAGLAKNVENALRHGPSETNLPLVPVPRGSNLSTSFSQRALWFHDQLEPGSCAYNLVLSYQLRGELDAHVLEKSISRIVARHEVLRTVFEAVDGQPVQKILPVTTIGLEVIDLSHLEFESLQGSEVRRFARVLAEQSFDLTQGPLLRPALLRLASHEHVFLLAIHHIVFDGWSIGVFFRELSQIYNCLKSGKPCLLPELPIQYADFAMWERQRLSDANLENALSYWKRQLDNLPTFMLPANRVQRIPERPSSGREEFVVSAKLLKLLRSLANRTGTTLFMVLLAAWKVALHRYTGQTDIAIGTPVAGRNHPAVEELIGYFLNLVVLRSDLSGDPTVRELLERIRRVCIDAFAYQEVPFQKLVEELRPTRHVTTNPLVQATFALQNTPQQSLNLSGIAARDFDVGAGLARPFDLHLYVIEEEAALRGYVSYNKSLFETDTIKRLINHLKNLLKAMPPDQDERISALPMLTEQEKHQLLVGWNDTEAEYASDKCVHELFENQAEKTPDAVAVIFEKQQLTYRELNQRANQLAHYLKRCGVGPGVLSGICVERSLEMVVGILGILKAGGAYVPLDPSHPTQRLGFMIEDAQVRMLLTQENLIAENIPCNVVCLDRDWQEIARESARNPESRALAEDLAYVLYTSGSTGTPKGVLVQHRSVVNLFAALNERVYADKNAPLRVSLNASITFDSSVKQLVQLLNGHTLYIVPDEYRVDGQALLRFMSRHELDVLDCTPAQARLLVEAGLTESAEHVAGLTLVGGEAIDKFLWMKLCNAQRTRAFNLYGPTECTVDSTVCEIQSGLDTTLIGSPIANVQIYILDGNLNPVPIGVPGELHIGGDGLARGYLNRPQLTGEKFIANPFSADPTRRLYKTGDRARYLSDGNIEFLGRVDDQVKIRGYRIELGEIEAVLAQHSAVQQSVVVAREGSAGDKRLVGYVVPQPETSFDFGEVKRYLTQKLPECMIPSTWVLLDELPLTPNGKVNREALPAPTQSRPELRNVYQAARTPIEETLAAIWGEVLKIDKIGIHDNFFDSGGHSLLATQIVSRIRGCLSIELPLRLIFESPTVAELAAAIDEIQTKSSDIAGLARTLGEMEAMTEEEAQNLLGT